MSHEVETMMSVQEVPWHKQGTIVEDLQTAEEALRSAGLNWEVEAMPCYYQEGKVFHEIPDKQVIVRKTDGQVYNITGKGYVPTQNAKCFNFFDGVIGSDHAKYSTAGSLKKGGVIWLLAKLSDCININGDDIEEYILLTNSHNGEFALQMFMTEVRVVCKNTLGMAQNGIKANRFYARHTANIENRIENAQDILGMANVHFKAWTEEARYMVGKQMNTKEFEKFLEYCFPIPEPVAGQDTISHTRTENQREMVRVLAQTGMGMDNPAIQGTAWQNFNAVAEYTDHERNYKNDALHGIWFGSGAELKRKAWAYLLSRKN